jgi:hypothetical protein
MSGMAWLALVLIALGSLGWWWTHPPDPAAELGAHSHPLARVERVPAPELGVRAERWRMISAAGDTVTGLWRGPALGAAADAEPHAWTVVMLGGIAPCCWCPIRLPSACWR